MGELLWRPSAERVAATQFDHFRREVAASIGIQRPDAFDAGALHRWSVDNPGEFWTRIWDLGDVIGDRGEVDFDPSDGSVRRGRFFPGAVVCLAENLLAARPGADSTAIVARTEAGSRREMSWDELRAEVAALAAALRADGVQPGDRVAAYMPHVIETIVTFLAVNAIGATFTSTSSDFGAAGVVDRFGQTKPTVLVAADGYEYGGKRFECVGRLAEIVSQVPSIGRTVVVPVIGTSHELTSWDDYLAAHRSAPLAFTRMPGDHPAYVLYSSGTTGKPKCITHRSLGVLLMHLKEQRLHTDLRAGDRFFYFTTCGWMMWNWLVSGLASGATLVLFDGNPFHPSPAALFDLAHDERLTQFGISAKFIDSANKAGLRPIDTHDLSPLRTVLSTGSPLGDDGFRWVYSSMKADVHLSSISGGTDLCGCFVGGTPTLPVYAGEIQGPMLAMDMAVYDTSGVAIDSPGTKGELVCRSPFPSVPVGFWGDDERGTKFDAAYFDRFPGVWAHGDFASWTDHGGMVIHGRSDATLNAGGVRIGTAEIYAQVETFAEVAEAVAVGQEWDGDTRIVLFVRLAAGAVLSPDLEARIRTQLRTAASPRHVPARIVAVTDVPRTRSNKISELAVNDVVNGREVRNTEALANPESLEQFRNRPELAR